MYRFLSAAALSRMRPHPESRPEALGAAPSLLRPKPHRAWNTLPPLGQVGKEAGTHNARGEARPGAHADSELPFISDLGTTVMEGWCHVAHYKTEGQTAGQHDTFSQLLGRVCNVLAHPSDTLTLPPRSRMQPPPLTCQIFHGNSFRRGHQARNRNFREVTQTQEFCH